MPSPVCTSRPRNKARRGAVGRGTLAHPVWHRVPRPRQHAGHGCMDGLQEGTATPHAGTAAGTFKGTASRSPEQKRCAMKKRAAGAGCICARGTFRQNYGCFAARRDSQHTRQNQTTPWPRQGSGTHAGFGKCLPHRRQPPAWRRAKRHCALGRAVRWQPSQQWLHGLPWSALAIATATFAARLRVVGRLPDLAGPAASAAKKQPPPVRRPVWHPAKHSTQKNIRHRAGQPGGESFGKS